jgi:hypothetical protein
VAIYELREAELDGLAGQGYAYPVKTFRGKEYKGVFFGEDEEALQALAEKGPVPFSGTVYESTRERSDTLTVDVVQTLASGIGPRADFVVKEEEDEEA